MIITDVQTHVLQLDFKIKIGAMPSLKATGLYVNIKTDEGIDGWGLSHWNLSNSAQKRFIDEALKPLLIKKDPFMIEDIFHTIYHTSNRILFGIPMATSVIQVALWDLVGKAVKTPIYRLLGGMKKKVRAYASLFRPYKNPRAAVGAVQAALDLGGV